MKKNLLLWSAVYLFVNMFFDLHHKKNKTSNHIFGRFTAVRFIFFSPYHPESWTSNTKEWTNILFVKSEDEKQTAWVQSVTKFHFTQIDRLSEAMNCWTHFTPWALIPMASQAQQIISLLVTWVTAESKYFLLRQNQSYN